MRLLFIPLAVFVLAACDSQEPAPAPTATAVPTAEPTPTMAPPDKDSFAAAYAEACPKAKKVSTAICRSEGFGKEGFVCDYGLGEDPYPRNTAKLTPGDGKWVLADADKACSAGTAH